RSFSVSLGSSRCRPFDTCSSVAPPAESTCRTALFGLQNSFIRGSGQRPQWLRPAKPDMTRPSRAGAHMMDAAKLVAARDRLLATAQDYFARQGGVVGVYVAGSLPAGTADAYSDIDLRVVVETAAHRDFVGRRLDIPRGWDGFLFNEWVEGA